MAQHSQCFRDSIPQHSAAKDLVLDQSMPVPGHRNPNPTILTSRTLGDPVKQCQCPPNFLVFCIILPIVGLGLTDLPMPWETITRTQQRYSVVLPDVINSNMQIRFSVAMRDLIEFLFVLNGSQQHIVDNLPKDYRAIWQCVCTAHE